MLDIDGTIIRYDYQASPSKRVIEAIKKAQNKVTVSLVTGRSYRSTRRLLQELGITHGYAVVDGGAIIMDVSTHTPLYENFISKSDVEKILTVFEEEDFPLYVKDKYARVSPLDRYTPHPKGKRYEKVSQFFTDEVMTLEDTHRIMKKLSVPTITVMRTLHKKPGIFGVNIANSTATKLHGVVFISKKLGITRDEIIGVGDGYNDFPLLEASGLKVAMGNAIPDLKAVSDYIAPDVDEDGVADVIEKYILN